MKRLLLTLVLLGLVAVGCGERPTRTDLAERKDGPRDDAAALFAATAYRAELGAALRNRLATPLPELGKDERTWDMVVAAYRKQPEETLWLDRTGPRANLAQLRTALASSASDGLDPSRYDLETVLSLLPEKKGLLGKRLEPALAAEADVRITLAAVRFARDLVFGQVAPETKDKRWVGAEGVDIGSAVAHAARSREVEAALRTLAPSHPQYERLRTALAQYRELAQRGVAWPQVPQTLKVKKLGDGSPAMPALRARLAASGHLALSPAQASVAGAEHPAANADHIFDPALEQAVQRFQREHGLEDDGVPGKSTIAALNVPLADRVRQIELTLERWRWLPDDLGATHVLVNVPTFRLEAVEDGRVAVQMRVVTGTRATPTPIFSDMLETVVLSPYWNVPSSILRGEVIPGLNRDPGYLARKGMEVLRNGQRVSLGSVSLSDPGVRVRQRPGSGNSLGQVKFLFPNEYDVYLHDTPADALFARAARAFSHGCVRLEQPYEFAQWALRQNPEWTPEKILEGMNSGREQHVRLERHVPVHIVYQTAWVEDDGSVLFAEDVYRHDERQLALLPPTESVSSPMDAVAAR